VRTKGGSMARYFFDSGDRDDVMKDEVGVECIGIEDARRAGIEGLMDLTREFLRDVDGQQLFVEIRDESGDKLAKLTLSLQTQPVIKDLDRSHYAKPNPSKRNMAGR